MVTLSNVEYTVADSLPVARNPPVLAVYASHIRRMICPGDTVRVIYDALDSSSSTLCRAIDIADLVTASQSAILAHPANHGHDSTCPLILIQLIISQSQSEHLHPGAIWPITNGETRMATRGLTQVAHTNCVLWIHPEMVMDIITVFHTNQCSNQTYGAVAGRENAFYTCSNALFDHDDCDSNIHVLKDLSAHQYHIFGPSTNSSNPSVVTETERDVETKYYLHQIFQKLLIKLGKIGGTAVYTGHLSRSDWSHLSSFLGKLDPSLIPLSSAIQSKDTAQAILHGDLSLETKFIPTTHTSITVKSPSQFDALRSCFSRSIGIGIKKRPPNKTDRKEGRRVFSLQRADIVNLVDMDLAGLGDNAMNNDWFPDDAVQQHLYFNSQRNYCRFRYDQRLREIRVTIKAMAIKVGNCDAEPFINFLEDNGIPWGQDEEDEDEIDPDGLRIRRGVVIDDEVWMIAHVDRENDTVKLVSDDPELGQTMDVTIKEACDNLLPG